MKDPLLQKSFPSSKPPKVVACIFIALLSFSLFSWFNLYSHRKKRSHRHSLESSRIDRIRSRAIESVVGVATQEESSSLYHIKSEVPVSGLFSASPQTTPYKSFGGSTYLEKDSSGHIRLPGYAARKLDASRAAFWEESAIPRRKRGAELEWMREKQDREHRARKRNFDIRKEIIALTMKQRNRTAMLLQEMDKNIAAGGQKKFEGLVSLRKIKAEKLKADWEKHQEKFKKLAEDAKSLVPAKKEENPGEELSLGKRPEAYMTEQH